jgi:hypothetical protein
VAFWLCLHGSGLHGLVSLVWFRHTPLGNSKNIKIQLQDAPFEEIGAGISGL